MYPVDAIKVSRCSLIPLNHGDTASDAGAVQSSNAPDPKF